MIKLFNHTEYPDELLKKILHYTETRIGVKGTTAVKVVEHRNRVCCSGLASPVFPYLGWLKSKRWTSKQANKKGAKKYVGDFGCITLRLPKPKNILFFNNLDSIKKEDIAGDIVTVALHEMGHIKDFREYKIFFKEITPSGRRVAHDKRAVEISADNQVYDARPRTQSQKDKYEALIAEIVTAIEKVGEEK